MAELARRGVEFSIGVKQSPTIRALIAEIPQPDWVTITDYPGTGPAQIAEAQLGTFRLQMHANSADIRAATVGQGPCVSALSHERFCPSAPTQRAIASATVRWCGGRRRARLDFASHCRRCRGVRPSPLDEPPAEVARF